MQVEGLDEANSLKSKWSKYKWGSTFPCGATFDKVNYSLLPKWTPLLYIYIVKSVSIGFELYAVYIKCSYILFSPEIVLCAL